jgi:hypothetical protein
MANSEATFSRSLRLFRRLVTAPPVACELEAYLSSNGDGNGLSAPLPRFDAVAHIRGSWFTALSEHNPDRRVLTFQFLEAGV